MKKMMYSLVFVLIASLSYAQTSKPTTSANVLKQIEVLKKADLNLSDIQISRITAVLNGEEQIVAKMKKMCEGNKTLLETKMTECKTNKVNNIKGAMTPQQVEKFEMLKVADIL